ncbi:hypothetical protein A2160_04580 [Candidatus Beckwithbacteria bacterium RBG_13_42_9]|uniref:Uncharacterized protein n=1 Tax=Candidatus Beckwithbacteria bacterium RBG_13_42_9 TaxID=1797457 RepID=A0A1F5E9V3_9BACT|nr:MAG: hypothetical protein A2160_04580 [Candidatus Beckwithbacteria bacterium RBG_13_42_9]
MREGKAAWISDGHVVDNPNDVSFAPERAPDSRRIEFPKQAQTFWAKMESFPRILIPVELFPSTADNGGQFEVNMRLDTHRLGTRSLQNDRFNLADKRLAVPAAFLIQLDTHFQAIVNRSTASLGSNPDSEIRWLDDNSPAPLLVRRTKFPQDYESFAQALNMVTKGHVSLGTAAKGGFRSLSRAISG